MPVAAASEHLRADAVISSAIVETRNIPEQLVTGSVIPAGDWNSIQGLRLLVDLDPGQPFGMRYFAKGWSADRCPAMCKGLK